MHNATHLSNLRNSKFIGNALNTHRIVKLVEFAGTILKDVQRHAHFVEHGQVEICQRSGLRVTNVPTALVSSDTATITSK